ncbi:hypothetical protein TNCV_4207361 [Trichonephila clavipes]|nr:hypothetical protein TNCV_4207361 [Trichonephila clavipes]
MAQNTGIRYPDIAIPTCSTCVCTMWNQEDQALRDIEINQENGNLVQQIENEKRKELYLKPGLKFSTSGGSIEESLIGFFAVTEMTGDNLTYAIPRELGKNSLDIQNCRAQGYDNGENMKLLGEVNTRRYPRTENRVWSDQEDHEERGSKDRAASTCGPHSDSFNDTSRRRRSNCSTNNFQTPCRSKS